MHGGEKAPMHTFSLLRGLKAITKLLIDTTKCLSRGYSSFTKSVNKFRKLIQTLFHCGVHVEVSILSEAVPAINDLSNFGVNIYQLKNKLTPLPNLPLIEKKCYN